MSAAGIDAAFQQAWELRGSPYVADAVRALVERYERVPLTLAEESAERHARNARLIQLLRDTEVRPARCEPTALSEPAESRQGRDGPDDSPLAPRSAEPFLRDVLDGAAAA